MRISSLVENNHVQIVEISSEGQVVGPVEIAWLPVDDLPINQKTGWGVPVSRSARIFCIGLNYKDHAEEVGAEIPKYPTLFSRFLSSFSAHDQALIKPDSSEHFDYEGELVVVIGKEASKISKDQALAHVYGYSIANDGSIRDFQLRTQQWMSGKIFDRSGGLGPVIVSADELPLGASGLRIETRLNGELVQSSNTDQLIFPVADLVSYISQIMTLLPGDMILTGTPAGVGVVQEPQLFMKPGDCCEVEIEGIGTLRNTISSTELGTISGTGE
ncbi:fumarylacetoacetate hydrolase family protein [Kiloniella antarctica]|uniref:Fumarylacetoacetate hydrolase family protein n=1 Tax=Kiloniella antarctica TaxID=1550907 RepID=A0ABW5BM35_9PROT